MRGQIIKVIAGFYDIYVDKKIFRVRGSGKLRQQKQSPLVGDFVEFTAEAHIDKIYPRKNELIRPKVANVDQVAIITSLKEPNYSSLLLNKILAIVEAQNLLPLLIFTKSDLTDVNPALEYQNMNYQVHSISNKNGDNLAKLKPLFANKLTVFTGQTGAGKSSTIANLTNTEREVQKISKALGRGKHTTRVIEIILWDQGWVIDTPGFSALQIPLTKTQMRQSFTIFKTYRKNCQFKNCAHIHEQNCGIKKAVHEGKISQTRYQDYLKLYEEALDG